jgi:hypothetical protein
MASREAVGPVTQDSLSCRSSADIAVSALDRLPDRRAPRPALAAAEQGRRRPWPAADRGCCCCCRRGAEGGRAERDGLWPAPCGGAVVSHTQGQRPASTRSSARRRPPRSTSPPQRRGWADLPLRSRHRSAATVPEGRARRRRRRREALLAVGKGAPGCVSISSSPRRCAAAVLDPLITLVPPAPRPLPAPWPLLRCRPTLPGAPSGGMDNPASSTMLPLGGSYQPPWRLFTPEEPAAWPMVERMSILCSAWRAHASSAATPAGMRATLRAVAARRSSVATWGHLGRPSCPTTSDHQPTAQLWCSDTSPGDDSQGHSRTSQTTPNPRRPARVAWSHKHRAPRTRTLAWLTDLLRSFCVQRLQDQLLP